jgi:hypothetical protein
MAEALGYYDDDFNNEDDEVDNDADDDGVANLCDVSVTSPVTSLVTSEPSGSIASTMVDRNSLTRGSASDDVAECRVHSLQPAVAVELNLTPREEASYRQHLLQVQRPEGASTNIRTDADGTDASVQGGDVPDPVGGAALDAGACQPRVASLNGVFGSGQNVPANGALDNVALGEAALDNSAVVRLLQSCGLADQVLSRLWRLAATGSKSGRLDGHGFFVALKLVSLARAETRDFCFLRVLLPC